MDIKTTSHGKVTVVEIRGRIVEGEPAEQLNKVLRTLISQGRFHTIVDMEKVEWFDSTGIEIVVAHYVSVIKQGGRILFLKASDRVRHLFKLVRLEDRFGWAQTLEEALAWFETPAS
jgi:anti-sigma B factor antagonist